MTTIENVPNLSELTDAEFLFQLLGPDFYSNPSNALLNLLSETEKRWCISEKGTIVITENGELNELHLGENVTQLISDLRQLVQKYKQTNY
jgi:hypothetical protein